MIAVIDKTPMLFDEFIDWYPEHSENQYELKRGMVIEMSKPEVIISKLAIGAILTHPNSPRSPFVIQHLQQTSSGKSSSSRIK